MPYNGGVNTPWKVLVLVAATLVALSACAPQASRGEPDTVALATPSAEATTTVARIAHHRMEIGRLQTGAYTTNVLIDLELPRGVRWTVLEFSGDDYLLRFTNDSEPSLIWLVDPGGIDIRLE